MGLTGRVDAAQARKSGQFRYTQEPLGIRKKHYLVATMNVDCPTIFISTNLMYYGEPS